MASGKKEEPKLPSVIDLKDYAIMDPSAGTLQEVMRDNLEGIALKPTDLLRVKVPAAGGTSWVVPGTDGDTLEKELEGILVWRKDVRVYWEGRTPDGSPPTCSSNNTIIGIGNPGGSCEKCPMAAFGSAVNDKGDQSRGQACKQVRLLFMLRKDYVLPTVVYAPPSSLKALTNFFIGLTSRNMRYSSIMTRLSLKEEKNNDGVKYSSIVPTNGGRLSPDAANLMREYGDKIRNLFDRITVADFAQDLSDNEE